MIKTIDQLKEKDNFDIMAFLCHNIKPLLSSMKTNNKVLETVLKDNYLDSMPSQEAIDIGDIVPTNKDLINTNIKNINKILDLLSELRNEK